MRTLGFKPMAVTDDESPGPVPANLPQFKRIVTNRPYPAFALAASPRAKVAASSGYGAIDLFNPITGSPFGAIEFPEGEPLANKPIAHADGVLDCRFGPQGELATCGRDGTVKIWSAEGNEIKNFSIAETLGSAKQFATGAWQLPPGVKRFPAQVAFANDGSTLLTGDTAGQIHAWKLP